MTSLTTPGSRSYVPSPRSFAAVILALSLVTVGIVPSQAQAAKSKVAKKKDPREMEAREAFAAGSYKEALDIYTKLYAEKLHPTYLRNIGRCYQNLEEPDRAISSFREYLRKAKRMPADERTEVEGYIEEMEELQKKQAAAEASPPPVQPLPPVAPPSRPLPPPTRPLIVVTQPAPPPAPAPTPFYKRAWFWGVVAGVVVVGTVAGLWAGGVFSSSDSRPACDPGYTCGVPQ